MVKVIVAGGTGNVAREIIDEILAKKKHEVIVLSRNDANIGFDGVRQVKVNYNEKKALVGILKGVDVVLSFVLPYTDPSDIAQKNLIDASVEAGVKRFAASEWACGSDSGIPAYAGKDRIRRYLESVNQHHTLLEYTLFQPGLFLNFFTHPHPSAKHLVMSAHYIDFETRQAIILDDGRQPVTFTLVQDLAAVVAEALDYQQPWPTVGGVQGWQTTSADLVALGEKLRGAPFTIHRVSTRSLATHGLTTPWIPLMFHPAIPADPIIREKISRAVTADAITGISRGAWAVSDEWNRKLPAFRFADPETFLRGYWGEGGSKDPLQE